MRLPTADAARFRSGAVARLAGMPVATLRIWEQRHRAVQPATAPSGHRLYTAAEVQRVMLLRRLTGQGHAIGQIAGLDAAQLEALAVVSAGAASATAATPSPASGGQGDGAVLRLVVVGPTLAGRLLQPQVQRRLGGRLRPVATHATVDAALQAAAAAAGPPAADLLLWQQPALLAPALAALADLQRAWRVPRVAVLYRYAGGAVRQALAEAGALLVREPADDDGLAAWLAALDPGTRSAATGEAAARAAQAGRAAGSDPAGMPPLAAAWPGPLAPRRYDDATLASVAGLAQRLACECPRHVAELLMQLSSFEAYSAGCSQRDAADAALHRELQQVAGTARMLFEAALERLARHEGLALP